MWERELDSHLQLMQLMIQQMNNQASMVTTPTTPQQYPSDELLKTKPPEVLCGDDGISNTSPVNLHSWKYVICYQCGEKGHFAYRCPQKGKAKEDIHCSNCDRTGHRFSKCPRKKKIQYKVCNLCGKEGHFVKQCLLGKQNFLAPQAVLASKVGVEVPHKMHQVAKIPQSSKGKILSLEDNRRQQDSLKRKVVSQEQYVTSSSRLRVSQSQLNQAQVVTLIKTPGSEVQSVMQGFHNKTSQSQQNEFSKADNWCSNCLVAGHIASRCPQGRQASTSNPNIPDVVLIKTITPAAGGKRNRKFLSQILRYRTLGVPMPHEDEEAPGI